MEYLKNYTVMRSSDVGEVEEMVAGFSTPFSMEVTGDPVDFNARVGMAHIHDLELVHSTFGDARIDWTSSGGDEDGYFFFIPTQGGGEINHLNTEWEFSTQKGVIRDMGREASAFQEHFHSFVMTIPKDRLKDHARHLGGEKLAMMSLSFDPVADFTTPGGQLFQSTIHSISQALDGPLAQVNNELVTSQYSDLILTQVLTQLSNSVQDALNGQQVSHILPRHIKRAQDYIQAHADEKLDMAMLSEVAGCSYRTLQRGFMSYFDMSPQQYIRKVRLKGVYEELKHTPENKPISVIARKWGFGHMGRFAQEYLNEFGVRPKDR